MVGLGRGDTLARMPYSAWSSQPGPLDDLLRGAGARMHHEHGATLPADFGSSAGELAVCMRAVGIGLLDEGEDGESLAIVGPRAEELVRASSLEDLPVVVVREALCYFLVTTPREHAREVWQRLAVAGEGLGLGYVGSTALHNFLVQMQLRSRQTRA